MKKSGYYCKVCGQFKANEKFSGKGHSIHVCKECSRLSGSEQAERIALNRIENLPYQLSKAQKEWLKKRTKDRREVVKNAAREAYSMRYV